MAGGLAVVAALALGGTVQAQPGDTPLFSDNFESASLSPNWTVTTGGSGTATVQGAIGFGGSQAARITVPDYLSHSIAYMKHTLDQPVYAISAVGQFKIASAGCDENAGYSGGSVPLVRFFDTNNTRIAGLYRINGSCSKVAKLYVQHSRNFYRTGKNLSLNTWYKAELRITVSTPSESLVEVYLNNDLVYRSTIADNGLLPIASLNVHNEHYDQVGDLIADDIAVGTFPTTPPVNPCAPDTPAPATSDPGTTILADNFESFEFGAWSDITREGDATMRITTDPVHSGLCAARMRVTADVGSRANLIQNTPAGTTGVWADGWFDVLAPGANTSSNVPFFRMFTGGARVFDVYRVNGSGQAYMRLPNGSGSFSYVSLGRVLATNQWYHVKVHADASGVAEVWIDGALRYTSSSVPYGVGGFDSVMIGAEHFAQEGESAIDDVVIKALP